MRGSSKKVEFGGKLWRVSVLARLFGKKPHTVNTRLRAGMSLVEALNRPLYRGHIITVNDAPMKICQLAKAIGIHPSTIRWRIYAGWSAEEIVTPRQYRKGVTAWGRTQSLTAWAREVGKNRSTLRRRLDSGLSPEVAFRLAVDKAQSRAQKKQAQAQKPEPIGEPLQGKH